VREQIYRIDRMLTQLALSGILARVRGVVIGKCTRCDPGEGYGSLTLEEVFDDHVKPLGVPDWHGAMIGHIDRQFTLPLGVEAEIDAARGTIRLLESAVA
jgi:muramoyltetrapeptide carboxypeptidase